MERTCWRISNYSISYRISCPLQVKLTCIILEWPFSRGNTFKNFFDENISNKTFWNFEQNTAKSNEHLVRAKEISWWKNLGYVLELFSCYNLKKKPSKWMSLSEQSVFFAKWIKFYRIKLTVLSLCYYTQSVSSRSKSE